MTALRAAIRGKGHAILEKALRERLPFTTSGAMHGDTGSPYSTGQLPPAWKEWVEYARKDIVYTVYSYTTPIAFVTNDGEVHIPQVRYSVITSRHQGLLYLL